MAPKRSRGGRGGGESTAPPRRSKRHRQSATFEQVTDDPERILRAARSARRRGGRGGAATARGGHRETGGLRMQRASGGTPNETEEVPPTSTPPAPAHQPPTTSTADERQPNQGDEPSTQNEPPAGTEGGETSGALESATDGTAQGDEKGGEGTEESGSGSQRNREGEKSPGKRQSESDEEGDKEPKRPRTGNEESSGSTTAPEDPLPPPEDPCDTFRQSLMAIGPPTGPDLAQLEDPARQNENLDLFALFRAIAAVTEAITENGGTAFSLADPLHTRRDRGGTQTIARPGRDVLFPYAMGGRSTDAVRTRGGHLALFIFRTATEDDESFAVDNYDSSGRRGARANPDGLRAAYNETRDRLLNNEWLPDRVAALDNAPALPNNHPAPTQRNGWVCGLHVVFSAWTYALGLTQNNNAALNRVDFYWRGVQLVNLAMLGRLDSQTIRNFLACYGFIERDSHVLPDRVFAATRPFRTNAQLTEHIARIRLEDGLAELRTENPAIPSLETALIVVLEAGIELPDDALVNMDAGHILEQYQQAQEIAIGGLARAPADEGAGGSHDHGTSRTGPATTLSGETGRSSGDGASSNEQRSRTLEGAGRISSDQGTNESREAQTGPPNAPSGTLDSARTTSEEGRNQHLGSSNHLDDIRNVIRSVYENAPRRPSGRADDTERGRDDPSAAVHDRDQAPEQQRTHFDDPPPADRLLPRSTLLAGSLLTLFPNLPELQNEQEIRDQHLALGTLAPAAAPPSGAGDTQAPSPDEPPSTGNSPPPTSPSGRPRSAVHLGGLPSTTAPLLGPAGEVSWDEFGARQQRDQLTSAHRRAEDALASPPRSPPEEGIGGNDGVNTSDVRSAERADPVRSSGRDGIGGSEGGDSLPDYEFYEQQEAEMREAERLEDERRLLELRAAEIREAQRFEDERLDDERIEDELREDLSRGDYDSDRLSTGGDDDLERSLFGEDFEDEDFEEYL